MWTLQALHSFSHSFIHSESLILLLGLFSSVIMDAFVETKLKEWGFERHIPNFTSEEIDTQTFLSLTEESNRPLLNKLCGKIGPSVLLRKRIRRFKMESDGHVDDVNTEDR